MPILTILVGLPACGKSTLVAKMDLRNTFVYSTDFYIENAAKGQNSTYNEMFKSTIKLATKVMDEELIAAIRANMNVIADQTNLGHNKRKLVLCKFPKNYTRNCIVMHRPNCASDFAEWDRRLASRSDKIIPVEILNSMYNSYVVPTLEEGFDNIEHSNSFEG